MEFEFTKEQKRLQQEIHDFLTEEPRGELENPKIVPSFAPELYRKVAAKGWIGLPFPRQYGGQGLGLIEEVIFEEEVGRARAPLSIAALCQSVNMFGPICLKYGTEEQKRRYLTAIAKGEIWMGQAFTEPEAGSDLAAIQTRAICDGNYYIINGQKMFCTRAGLKHYIPKVYLMLLAVTDPDVALERGQSFFIVDLDLPGLTADRMVTMADSSTYQLYIEDVKVPKENLLGEEGQGWEVFTRLKHFYWSRQPGYYYGLLAGVLDELMQYVKDTPSLRKNPSVRQKLSELAIRMNILRLLTYRFAWAESKGIDTERAASIGKYFRDAIEKQVPNIGMEILGLYGQLRKGSKHAPLGGLLEVLCRSNVYHSFAGAGALLLGNFIATKVLGLPGRVFV